MSELSQSEQKKVVATHAIDTLIERGLIKSGMKIGLGTGSTAMPAVERLAQRIADGTLRDVKAVATSFQTSIACEDLGIPVYELGSREIAGSLDLAIDGADEISPEGHLIKGGGAAHLREKLVEYNAAQLVIIADESKAVANLGTKFPLPVEVLQQARVPVTAKLAALGATVKVREGVKKAGPVITDNGNIILDCTWEKPVDAAKLEIEINQIVGVIENGFFTQRKPIVFISHKDGSVEER